MKDKNMSTGDFQCPTCRHYNCLKPGRCRVPEFEWIPPELPPHKDFKVANSQFAADVSVHQAFIDTHIAPIESGRFTRVFCGLGATEACLKCHYFDKTLPKEMSYRCFGFGGCPGGMLSEEFKSHISSKIKEGPASQMISDAIVSFKEVYKKAYGKEYPNDKPVE